MSEHATNHTRNPGNGFKKNDSNEPFPFTHVVSRRVNEISLLIDAFGGVLGITREEVHTSSGSTHQSDSELILPDPSFSMLNFNRLHLFFGINRMWPSRTGELDLRLGRRREPLFDFQLARCGG